MIRPTTKHQKTKALKKEENTAALLNLGWVSVVEGKWFRPGSPYTYDFEDAVGLAKLAGKIKSSSSMASPKRGPKIPHSGQFKKKGSGGRRYER